jgi:hypothetical protein
MLLTCLMYGLKKNDWNAPINTIGILIQNHKWDSAHSIPFNM